MMDIEQEIGNLLSYIDYFISITCESNIKISNREVKIDETI